MTADIEKAFLQIKVDKSDRSALRFLWAENPFEEDLKIKKMRWIGVVFGVTSSPSHLAAVLHLHLDKMSTEYPATSSAMGPLRRRLNYWSGDER